MAKITRKFQKIFALTNDGSQRFGNGVFGSGKAGTKIITDDVEELQELAAFDSGWEDAVLVNSAGQPTLPPLPEMQALDYICTYQIAYLLQEGVPEYNADTTYFINSITKASGTYQLFGSVTDDNIGNATSDPANWALLVDLAAAASTNALTSVVNEMPLFADTSGRIFKKSTFTGIIKNTAGVASVATSGTEYSAGTSGLATGLLKSTTGTGALTIAAAGTDYLAPNGNGSGLTGLTASQISGLTFTGKFTSSQQSITIAGALTIAHGLGAVPFTVVTLMVCTVADLGYSPGDIIVLNNGASSGVGEGISMTIDSTNINVRYSSSTPGIQVKNTGAYSSYLLTSWRYVFKAMV